MHALSFPSGRRAALAMLAGSIALAVAAAEVPRPDATPDGVPAPSRGALLYDTHCITCHTEQMHWRDRRQARDWATLKAEVSRWQEAAQLRWTDEEVDSVTDHLNDTIYHFDPPLEQARRPVSAAGR